MVKKKTEDVVLRKAPKILSFLILGAVLGLVTAFILYTNSSQSTAASILGYLIVFCSALGAGVGAVVAIALDRALRRKSKVVKAEVSR